MSQQTTSIIPDALSNFDILPASANVRLPVVKALLDVSSSTVWRLVAAKKLRVYKLTPRTTTFNCGELREYILAAKALT
jgi:predicted DNA-binding transcriptional regulator AlpA